RHRTRRILRTLRRMWSELMIMVESLDPSHVDSGVAAHYGDPLREQRLLATELGLVDRSNRGVIAIPGAHRHSWPPSFTTHHLTDLAPMTVSELLALSPRGPVEHPSVAPDDGTMTLLDVEPGGVDGLLKFLLMMRFGMNVDPTDASAQWAVLSLVGPRALD